jgi:F-type H+-transporting ATPase subunit b
MLVALVLARVEEASPPLIDWDWTTVVQLGLFLVMAAILSQALFRPYLKMRADRERGIDGAKKEAVKMGDDSRHIVEEYDRKLADAKRRGNAERDKLRQEGVTHEREVLAKARTQVQTALDAAQKKIVADTATGREQLKAAAGPIAQQVASKILGREVA